PQSAADAPAVVAAAAGAGAAGLAAGAAKIDVHALRRLADRRGHGRGPAVGLVRATAEPALGRLAAAAASGRAVRPAPGGVKPAMRSGTGPGATLALFGPGLLLAATGVGAGDLATAAFAGGHLGVAVLWAVLVGALLKFVLNEGLARWQLATGQTFLEGVAVRFGRICLWMFLPYLLLWSYFVGAALISACGVATQALWPLTDDAIQGKRLWGVLHALAGL